MTTMEKIEDYLKEMGLVYRVVPSEDRIILPYNIRDRQFFVIIDRSDKWVRFHCRFLKESQIAKDNKLAFYKALLEANGNLAEVKYFVAENGDVGVVGHEGIEVLTLEGFKEEYNAIPFAISYFLDNIATKFNIEVSGEK